MCPSPALFAPTMLLIQQLLKTFCGGSMESVRKTVPKTYELMVPFDWNPVSSWFWMGHHLSGAIILDL